MAFEYQNEQQLIPVRCEDIDSNGLVWVNGVLYQVNSQPPLVSNQYICVAGNGSNTSPTDQVIVNYENGYDYFTGQFNNAASPALQNEIPNEFLQEVPNNSVVLLYPEHDYNAFTHTGQEDVFCNRFSEDTSGDQLSEPVHVDIFTNTSSQTAHEDVFNNQLHEVAQIGNDEITFTLPFDCVNIVQGTNCLKTDSYIAPSTSEEENIHFYHGPMISNELMIETGHEFEDDVSKNELKFGVFTTEPIQETVLQTQPIMYEVPIEIEVEGKEYVLVGPVEHKIQEFIESNGC